MLAYLKLRFALTHMSNMWPVLHSMLDVLRDKGYLET